MAKETLYPAMVCQTVVISRPDPSGRKDKDGNPVHKRIQPPIGKVYQFTRAEMEDMQRMAPFALRDPKNESIDFNADVDQAGAAAAALAMTHGAAAGDASQVAKTAAMGNAKQPDGTKSEQGPGDAADDEDL